MSGRINDVTTTQEKLDYSHASIYIVLAPATLAWLRSKGKGPEGEYTRSGVVFTKAELDKWMSTRNARGRPRRILTSSDAA